LTPYLLIIYNNDLTDGLDLKLDKNSISSINIDYQAGVGFALTISSNIPGFGTRSIDLGQ
jgi:hypothetical protein